MSETAEQRAPAFIASAILHAGVIAATLVAWPNFSKNMTLQASVPVTLVSHAPVADVRPAIEAPEAQTAQVETPPPPSPTPEPPAPEVVKAPPTPAPPPPGPKAAPPAPPKPQPTLDLNALAKSAKPVQRQLDLKALSQQKAKPTLDLDSLAAAGRPRNAQRGPNRAETDTQARQALGAASGLTADEASLLYDKLTKLWNPNCAAEGGANVIVKVRMRLAPNGALQVPPELVSSGSGALWQAAATRAVTAVARGAPYTELRRERYNVWKDIVFNFDARKVCFGG